VIELWAEERARLDGVLGTVVTTPAEVVKVRETYKFGPDHDPDRKPRWELVAAAVYGDASRDNVAKVKGLYKRGEASGESYAGRGRRF